MRTVLLLGASGRLGAHLHRTMNRLGVTVAAQRRGSGTAGVEHLDLGCARATAALVGRVQPGVVVWCARSGEPEAEPRLLEGLGAVLSTLGRDGRLVYVSTDGVLPGHVGPHDERVRPEPFPGRSALAAYTNAKLEAEGRIAGANGRHLVVRVGPIYGRARGGDWDGRTAAIRDALGRGEAVVRSTRLQRSFIHVADAASALATLALADAAGVLHLAPEEGLSYHAFACTVARAFSLCEDLVMADEGPLATPEIDAAPVRLDLRLDGSRARALTGPVLRSPAEALRADIASAPDPGPDPAMR